MTDFVEVADRIWVARYAWADANITAVGGDRGLVVVDTHASTAAGRQVVGDVRHIGAGEVVAVVNTHWHWDHSFGNAAFREAFPDVPIHAHEDAAAQLAAEGERARQSFVDAGDHADEMAATEIVVPDRTFSSAAVLDLGDRAVELVFPGRGHTSGDLVVRVPDADVVMAGDLVEESAKPWIGEDSYPLEWPLTLDIVLGLTTPRTVVVPGHGVPVDRDFVETQRHEIGLIGETIRHLASSGVPAGEAVAAGEWPWDAPASIANAVKRGYEHLPRAQKRLPLL